MRNDTGRNLMTFKAIRHPFITFVCFVAILGAQEPG